MSDDDLLEFADEPQPVTGPHGERSRLAWKILIVDDDEDVHRSTELSLSGTEILGRPLQFLHAHSAAEARSFFAQGADLAVILLDVVMETEDAGLRLVEEIRNRYALRETRIILRTGQPGYAPELEAIRDYDINDYKNKTELSRGRLYAALTAAIRTYMQIHVINAGRIGLSKIINGSASLLQTSGIAEFAAGVITQIAALLGLQPEGLVCARRDGDTRPVVIAAAGRFEHAISHPLSAIGDPLIAGMLERALAEGATVLEAGNGLALHIGGGSDCALAAYVDAELVDEGLDAHLIQMFCANVSVCLDNAHLLERLNAYSYYDQLLNLPNRRHLIELVDRHLAAGPRGDGLLAVIDVDHFGEINGALGHRFGDCLLQAVAERLAHGCGDAQVARVGSDTFAVFWCGSSPDEATLAGLFERPLAVEGNEITVSVTIGLVRLKEVQGDGSEALEDAFLALKQAKRAERGSLTSYTRRIGEEIRDRVNLLNELRKAFADDHLFLVYQPQIELASGRCVGAEALLRWRAADGRMVPPDRFIALAERSGLITPLGEWVIRHACRQAAEMAEAGFDIRMAINVSSIQFRDPSFLDKLRAAVADSGVRPHCIELEITESVAMGEPGRMIELFDQIKAMGLEVAIDDFGTGFSSLSYLQQMRVDRLKIDRSFVSELDRPGKGAEIAELVCGLGHRLGLELVAEGIETEAQAEALRAMGCELGQGWLYAKPMPAAEWLAWLRAHTGARG